MEEALKQQLQSNSEAYFTVWIKTGAITPSNAFDKHNKARLTEDVYNMLSSTIEKIDSLRQPHTVSSQFVINECKNIIDYTYDATTYKHFKHDHTFLSAWRQNFLNKIEDSYDDDDEGDPRFINYMKGVDMIIDSFYTEAEECKQRNDWDTVLKIISELTDFVQQSKAQTH